MKTYTIPFTPQTIAASVAALQNGGVLAAPTETVYGLMCRYDSVSAREKIYALKHRPASKQMQMLFSSLDDLASYGINDLDTVSRIAAAFWPGPLTLVVDTASGETLGLRMPNHPLILQLIKQLGAPLAATSANLSGEPPASTAQDAVSHLDGEPDILLDGGVVTTTGGTASTVASITGHQLKILRPGIITEEQLRQVVNK